MNVYITLFLSVVAIAICLRKKLMIGIAILSAGLVMWVCNDRSLATFSTSFVETVTAAKSWDLLFALYFVMCLEVQLRRSGTLQKMVEALNRLFHSARATIAVMPAFLGLLPSIGGALFSCPIVAQGSRGMEISAERKAAVNYFFRHVFETSSPTVPGMLLACAIAGISLSDLVLHLFWYSILAIAVGWIVLILPLKNSAKVEDKAAAGADGKPLAVPSRSVDMGNVVLAVSPVLLNIFLMMAFAIPAGISMGISVLALMVMLKLLGRGVGVKTVIVEAINKKLIFNVCCILYFIALLSNTGVLAQTTAAMNELPLPTPVSFAILCVFLGLLTGMSQGYIAVAVPICTAIAPGSLDYVALAMVFCCAGQMLTPVHLCFTISVEYFKTDFFKTLNLIFWCEVLMLPFYALWAWWTWPL